MITLGTGNEGRVKCEMERWDRRRLVRVAVVRPTVRGSGPDVPADPGRETSAKEASNAAADIAIKMR
jgi:hypothetical protein